MIKIVKIVRQFAILEQLLKRELIVFNRINLFQIKMKVAFCAINNETCRSLADRLLTQGIKVTFLCLDCFDIEVASQMIDELKVVGKEQGEHIKILLVVCELFYRVSHNKRYKNILSKHLI